MLRRSALTQQQRQQQRQRATFSTTLLTRRSWSSLSLSLSTSSWSTTAKNNSGTSTITKRYCGFLAVVDNIWGKNSHYSHDSSHGNKSLLSSCNIPLLTNLAVLEQTTAKLRHRGPDGQQTARGSLLLNGGAGVGGAPPQWAMGHTRLAIVDPHSSQANMPFVLQFDHMRIVLVANGEIYNHEAVYDTLVRDHGWTHPRQSHSDCEVIAHACACLGPEQATKLLDGMFAFTILLMDHKKQTARLFCARDPVGIKPLYYGQSKSSTTNTTTTTTNVPPPPPAYLFASELKALVDHVNASTVQAIPPGHSWSPEQGLVRYYQPAWLCDETYQPGQPPQPTPDELREAFRAAVKKRMMSDVDYGFFLSGGVDSCIVAHALLPMYRADHNNHQDNNKGDDRPIPCFTVGMEDSPDLMAAQAMVQALGGPKYVDHRRRIFTANEVFDLIPHIIYHMETYEAELIRSAIPNWFLAERAGADVKMVLTGEGADELFAGYLYFMDAQTPTQVQTELKRIYGMLGDINLHRTDRMTMAHGLEARVPFLDTKFTALAMSLDPAVKMVQRDAVARNAPGREKTFLRQLFAGPNDNGHSIPTPVLWRAKAMQCEGVGEDWVSLLQARVSSLVTDAELAAAPQLYPQNPPQTKEEVYYRRIYEEYFPNLSHVITPWEGGCRAGGAAWESTAYTRTGLGNTNLLTHAFQKKAAAASTNIASATAAAASFSTRTSTTTTTNKTSDSTKRLFSTHAKAKNDHHRHYYHYYSSDGRPSSLETAQLSMDDAIQTALACGYTPLEATLTSGGDDRSRIHPTTGTNKYHIRPQPMKKNTSIFRGSCTCNAPTERGMAAAQALFQQLLRLDKEDDHQNHDDHDHDATVFHHRPGPDLSPAQLDWELRHAMEAQRQRLAACLQLPPGTQIVFMPSGSDAEYVPLVLARMLNPEATQLVNIVTQLQEIGAGSAPAAAGEYFSTHAPLLGKLSTSSSSSSSSSWLFGNRSKNNNNNNKTRLHGFQDHDDFTLRTITIPARDRATGTPLNASKVAMEHAEQVLAEAAAAAQDGVRTTAIVHGVFGGKTGMRDEIMPASQFLETEDGTTTMMVMGVVDACQGRFALADLHAWLEQDSIVLFTGSKFYQAPPFCGAVIIPKRMAEQLRKINMSPPEAEAMLGLYGLGGFITDKELPDCLDSWKPLLTRSFATEDHDESEPIQYNNVGLALRWEAALAEMEHLAGVAPKDIERQVAVEEWASAVSQLVQAQQPWLDAWCVEQSIVSIRLSRQGDVSAATAAAGEQRNGENPLWFNMKELREVYRYMSLDLSNRLDEQLVNDDEERRSLSVPVSLGQPVDVADSYAIVRIALGSASLVEYLQDASATLAQDALAVQKLALVAKYFDILQQQEKDDDDDDDDELPQAQAAK
ncbi:hypothetical protein ACA910_001314 [Epithemia clementina (nom. ined.)]